MPHNKWTGELKASRVIIQESGVIIYLADSRDLAILCKGRGDIKVSSSTSVELRNVKYVEFT